MSGRERVGLNRERIARVALELLDEDGVSGLGMRSLATRLGVRAPSLYHHVSGVEEVIGLVHDLVDLEIDLTALDDADWRRGLARFAHSYRAAFLVHPNMMPLVARVPLVSRVALAVYESLATALERIGVAPGLVAHYMGLLDNAVVGSVLNDFVEGFQWPPDVAPGEYPRLHAVLADADLGHLNDETFRAGIALIIEDIAKSLSEDPARSQVVRQRAKRATPRPRSDARRSWSR